MRALAKSLNSQMMLLQHALLFPCFVLWITAKAQGVNNAVFVCCSCLILAMESFAPVLKSLFTRFSRGFAGDKLREACVAKHGDPLLRDLCKTTLSAQRDVRIWRLLECGLPFVVDRKLLLFCAASEGFEQGGAFASSSL